jgi:UPF0288 family protein (methanogenesis marker protein 3)
MLWGGWLRVWRVLKDLKRGILFMLPGSRVFDQPFFKKVDSTGEPFGGTNVVGRVVKGLENLEKFKEGDTVYVARS